MRVVRLLKGVLVLAGVSWALLAGAQSASPGKSQVTVQKTEKAQTPEQRAALEQEAERARERARAQEEIARRGSPEGRQPDPEDEERLPKTANSPAGRAGTRDAPVPGTVHSLT